MDEKQEDEILEYISQRYQENVPRAVRALAKGKIKKIQNFQVDDLPENLRKCTVEELLEIVKAGIAQGKLKI